MPKHLAINDDKDLGYYGYAELFNLGGCYSNDISMGAQVTVLVAGRLKHGPQADELGPPALIVPQTNGRARFGVIQRPYFYNAKRAIGGISYHPRNSNGAQDEYLRMCIPGFFFLTVSLLVVCLLR
jgi:hypothetical protein